MEKEALLVTMTKDEFINLLHEEFKFKLQTNEKPDFESDKITKEQAAKLLNKSIPTLNKLIQAGVLKVYGVGMRGKFLLKSEIIAALRS
jgi:excisionase family DNA binding protein